MVISENNACHANVWAKLNAGDESLEPLAGPSTIFPMVFVCLASNYPSGSLPGKQLT
jgi:hypothetical protein